VSRVIRDGRSWLAGTAADVAWIHAATPSGVRITAAIPPMFDDYGTIVLPDTREEQQGQERAVVALLRRQSPDQQWWIGYLDTGCADVVFTDAPSVTLYANWPYVLVQAGPEQAASWRSDDFWPLRSTRLPDLMFDEPSRDPAATRTVLSSYSSEIPKTRSVVVDEFDLT
jgi:hypothetical protein